MIIKFLVCCCALAVPLAAGAAEPDQDAMTVVRDPQTGKLRAPTADEVRALRASTLKPNAQPVLPAPKPTATTRPDGTRAINLGERAMVFAVMTRGADGKLAGHCVRGEDAAAKAVEQPQETNHER
jgi:hypothetical protein